MLFRASLIVFVVIAIVGFGHTSPAFSQDTVHVHCPKGTKVKVLKGVNEDGDTVVTVVCKKK